MLIELIDKLIDRVIQLAKYKKEADRNFFENYLKPIYEQFEMVHEEYLSSFLQYRKMLLDEKESISRILDKIEEDIIFGAGRRGKVTELTNLSDDPLLGKFFWWIWVYLHIPSLTDSETLGPKDPSNVPRSFLVEIISRISSRIETKAMRRRMIIKNLDKLVREMQSNYTRVTREYIQLQKRLLNSAKLN